MILEFSPFEIRDCNFIAITLTFKKYSKKAKIDMSTLFLSKIMTLEFCDLNHLLYFLFFKYLSFTSFEFLTSVVIIITFTSDSE